MKTTTCPTCGAKARTTPAATGDEDALTKYIRSIPNRTNHICLRPIMVEGLSIGCAVTYELDGALIKKEIFKPERCAK